MAHLTVHLVTPQKDVAHGSVDQLTAPSVMGEVGILPDHLPLLADMQEGPLCLFREGKKETFAISGGFIEVNRNAVTVLAETAEKSSDIDVRRAQRALADAEKQLKQLDFTDPQFAEQEARARRARVRLLVAEGAGS